MLRPVEIKPELLGQPLPWDLYDRYGVLLLARGAMLEDAAQAAAEDLIADNIKKGWELRE